jgi:hypothetical protein
MLSSRPDTAFGPDGSNNLVNVEPFSLDDDYSMITDLRRRDRHVVNGSLLADRDS